MILKYSWFLICLYGFSQLFSQSNIIEAPQLIVLGTAQDAGYPQAGCEKDCCSATWGDAAKQRYVAALAVADPASSQRWVIDATPDIKNQIRLLDELAVAHTLNPVDGIFLTHAHIGHYTGLMQLGREVMGTKSIPVYAMARMTKFLTDNGPWSQLVSLQNISLQEMKDQTAVILSNQIRVTPFTVPHRDEFSETAGYHIQGPNRSAIYIPDIDKWEKWDEKIEDWIAKVDFALLDGTFFANGEIPGRDMSQIPHPFIEESMARFASLPASEKGKIYFIHLNHTNPALAPGSEARTQIVKAGFHLAEQGQMLGL